MGSSRSAASSGITSGVLSACDAFWLGSTLSVAGVAKVIGDFSVSDSADFRNALSAAGNFVTSGSGSVSQAMYVGKFFSVLSDTCINGKLAVATTGRFVAWFYFHRRRPHCK